MLLFRNLASKQLTTITMKRITYRNKHNQLITIHGEIKSGSIFIMLNDDEGNGVTINHTNLLSIDDNVEKEEKKG
jgi:hypothetical protein